MIFITQARSKNTRLPNKNFEIIGNKMIIEHHLSKLNSAESGLGVKAKIIALPYNEPRLKDYEKIAKEYGWTVEMPVVLENDLLARFTAIAIEQYIQRPFDWVARFTSDCYNLDYNWIYNTCKMAIENKIPVFNSYREGTTVEVFRVSDLLIADKLTAKDDPNREHCTMCFKKGFNKGSIDTLEELQKERAEYDKRK
jgi:spore coat polysaccharide biosynthesis protein SpsF (cytidylyltransferase family)